MRSFKILITAALITLMTALFCSCVSDDKIVNTLNTIDMSAVKSKLKTNKNVSSNSNGQEKSGEDNKSDGKDDAETTVAEKLSASDKKNKEEKSDKKKNVDNVTAYLDGKNNSNKDKDDKKNDSETVDAEGSIREVEDAVEERFMQYMPELKGRIIEIVMSDNGVTVVIARITDDDFENYTMAIKHKGFIAEPKESGSYYFAKNAEGIFVEIQNSLNEVQISVYDDEKHFK